MIAKIFINGTIGVDTTLESVISQYKSYHNPSSVEVYINSRGGFVNSGWGIYDYLKNLSVPVTTICEMAYSIASVIFMAGDIRKVEEGENRLMVHFPWVSIEGDSRELREAATFLEQMEATFINFYAEQLQLDHTTISNLLLNETYINSEQAISMGFANQKMTHEFMAMAYIGSNTNENNETMNKMEKFYMTLKNFFQESEVQNLVIQDCTGKEIKFPELELGQTPSQGDKALIGNQPANEEIILADGSTYVFQSGVLQTIKEVEVAGVEARAEASEEAVQEVAEETSEETVDETTTEEVTEETNEVPVEVEEVLEENQETVVETEVEEVATQVNEQVDIDALINQLEESIIAKLDAKYKTENEALKAEINTLRNSIGSDVVIQPSQTQRQTTNTGGNFLTDALRGR